MIITAICRKAVAGQNPAHRPTRSPDFAVSLAHLLQVAEIWVLMKLYAAQLNFRDIAHEFGVDEKFTDEVHRQAAMVTDRRASRRDLRDIPFVTIDPVGSMDLDQAMHIERSECPECADDGEHTKGWHVRYAIADVGSLIDPASELFEDSMRRGQTIYLPDEPTRLHPAELSEAAGSLLPDQERCAVVWDICLDGDGEVTAADVYPALVKSVARLDYEQVQRDFDDGNPHPSIAELVAVGQARQRSALRRNAINLRLPSQSVIRHEDTDEPAAPSEAKYELVLDARPPVMDYNSEISLLAGMIAGELMASAGLGVVRSLEPADSSTIEEFLVAVTALGFKVPAADGGLPTIGEIGEFLAGLDPETPPAMAVMKDTAALMRGADYIRLSEANQAPIHAGVGGVYAHVTAPLRRLIDRFGLEFCLAIAAHRRGESEEVELPQWATARLDDAIEVMRSSGKIAGQVDAQCLSKTEAVVLEPWLGDNFGSVVLHRTKKSVQVLLDAPPVLAQCISTTSEELPEEGTRQMVSLIEADPESRIVRFAWPAD